MGRYFGTDGIRGKANETLDVQRAFQVGRYLGYYFSRQGKGRILVGKDTRLSSGMFENAIAAGASASGADVYLLGYCPTPSVAYLVKREQFSCGVMISASHNPYYDNGIKVFSQAGIKLSAEIEALVEDYIDGLTEIPLVSGEKIGQVIRYDEGLEHYLDWLESLFDFRLEQFHLALDLANGSATTTAEKLLRRMGAHCTVIHSEPNGVNINTKCGSTHPESLQELMKSGIFDLGLAFDGDADRLIAVDPQGNLINGDYVLYICGKYLKENGLLHGNTVVSTVMANLGFFKAMEQLDIATESTQVGDKYVYDVKVTSPSKDVPVAVELQGEMPEGKAIEEIIFDHSSVKIYAQQSVLDKLDKVSVQLDATKLTSDTKMYQTITLPTGVRQINPARVNMDIKLGDAVSKTIDNVAINAINNTNRYNVQTKDDQIAVSVTVYGTQANVDKITAGDIYVYFDMKDLQPGEQEVILQVNQDAGTYVKYTLQQASLTVNITDPSHSAATDNNNSDGGAN